VRRVQPSIADGGFGAANDLGDLQRVVRELTWHHQIDLGNGIVTPGRDRSAHKLEALRLPPLTSKSVLDVGAWDGYFAFAAERLGASRVVALDSVIWRNVSKVPFEVARRALGSRVEDIELEVVDINPDAVGVFDVVLFLGVLYHMRDPMRALEAVSSVTRELLVVETLSDMNFTRRPVVAFYPSSYLDGDHSNWWGPNIAATVAMLEEFGFARVEVINKRGPLGRVRMAARNLGNVVHSRLVSARTNLPLGYVATDRLIVHAYRNDTRAS
jgi:tRNA (mo5U34)-methyltransferase